MARTMDVVGEGVEEGVAGDGRGQEEEVELGVSGCVA